MSLGSADAAHIEICRRNPMYFRKHLIIDGKHGPERWGDNMSDLQVRDFAAVDEALKHLAGIGPKPTNQRFWLQRSRGYSKTTDRASDVLWLLWAAGRKIDAVVAGEDREQALLIREQMLKLLQYNNWLYEWIDPQSKRIKNKKTDSTLNSLSRDTASSFGLTPEFVIADEFTHWRQQDFWSSLFSSFNKTAHRGGTLIIACNAGVGFDWHWKVKQLAITSPLWYHSSPEGHAPWYNDEDIAEQRMGLSYSEFMRLWMNVWQESGGEFVTREEADACVDPNLTEQLEGKPGWGYVAALDYAEKKDRTVGVVGHLYGDEIVVDRMDVVDPKTLDSGIVPVSWCENWINTVTHQFGSRGSIQFVVDKYQLLYVMQKLEESHEIYPFAFSSGTGNFELATILKGLILHKKIRWYPDCGIILDKNGRPYRPQDGKDTLVTELSKLTVNRIGSSSRWRFNHLPNEHDDRAFALGAMARHIVINSGGVDQWNITPPSITGSFAL